MKGRYDSPLQQKQFNLSNTKLQTPKFRTLKLFKQNSRLSSANIMTDIYQGNNFALKVTKNKKLRLKRIRKPIEYDSEFLKSDLISYRSEVQKRKNELLRLKIKYGKLMMDNTNNKSMLAKILNIKKDKYITKGELIFKINNCKINKEERQSLKYAHEILKLKLELNTKKKIYLEKAKYLAELNQNSKLKNITNLQSDYLIKCEQQKTLLDKLAKLERKYNKQENKVNEMQEKLTMQNITCENLLEKEVNGVEKINKMMDTKVSLEKQIQLLRIKIKNYKKSYISKEKEIKEKERYNSFGEQKLNIIREYSYLRSEDSNNISQMTKNKEKDETLLKNYTQEISILQEEYNELYAKLSKYRDEKPKLIRKSILPKKIVEKIDMLEKNLEMTKNLKEESEKKHKEIQKELNQINNENNLDSIEYNRKIEENINIKKDLEKKINELKKKRDELNNKNNEIITSINELNNEYIELSQNETDLKTNFEQRLLTNQEDIKKIREEKKKQMLKLTRERKNEIDKLKKEQIKLSHDNKIIEDENKYITEELNGYNQGLESYEKIEQELKDAMNKLNTLKGK